MFRSLSDISSDELNKINLYSDASCDDSYHFFKQKELDDLNEVYPFTPCEFHAGIKTEIFKTDNIIKISRKDKYDNKRKKFKSNFHKCLRQIINAKLKKVGSKYLLESFPQNFIIDVTITTNYEVMHLTYEKLFDYTEPFINDDKNNKGKQYLERRNKASEKKYKKNKEVLKYLNLNSKLSEESGWERIKNMKYKDLLNAYLNSNEFQQYIKKLCKNEKIDNIKDFIFYASTYIGDYLSHEAKENKSQRNIKCYSEKNNHILGLNIPLLIPFPPSIFDMTENEDKDMHESLFSSWKGDNNITNNNSIFINSISKFESEDYQLDLSDNKI